MNVYRYKRNKLLYTIVEVTPRGVLGRWYEAIPFCHGEEIGVRGTSRFKANMSLDDFEPVAHR